MSNLTNSKVFRSLEEINDKYTTELLPLVCILVLLMAVGSFGNGLVVYVYLTKIAISAKRSFIMTLAILDLTVCVIVIPFEIHDIVNQVTFTVEGICKSMRVLEYVTVLSAGFVLVSVSFERYYFICKAFKEFTPQKANIICVVCVLSAILLSFPSGMITGSKRRTIILDNANITGHECSMNSENEDIGDYKTGLLKQVYYYSLAFVFISCFTMFIVLYSIIGRLLYRYQRGTLVHGLISPSDNAEDTRKKKVSVDSQSAQSIRSGQNDTFVHGRRTIKSLRSIVIFFSVTVVFVVSFLPHLVVRILGFFSININSTLLYNSLIRSYLVSNVSNPFIYSIFNATFRKELKRTLWRMNDVFIPTRWTTRRKPKPVIS